MVTSLSASPLGEALFFCPLLVDRQAGGDHDMTTRGCVGVLVCSAKQFPQHFLAQQVMGHFGS